MHKSPIYALAFAAFALVPELAACASKPCPPPQVGAAGGTTATTACGTSNGSYSTNFPANENPISESGNWTNTVSNTWSAPVSTTGGHAVGLGSTGVNDSIAMLVGNYGRDQTISATVYRGGSSGAAELELHLRMTMIPGSTDKINTYEIDIVPSLAWVVVAKWQGAQGAYANLGTGTIGSVNDGDVFTASAIGPVNNTVFTVTKNGATILTVSDTSAYVTGNPGIGFDAGSSSDGANFGWKAYSVTTQ